MAGAHHAQHDQAAWRHAAPQGHPQASPYGYSPHETYIVQTPPPRDTSVMRLSVPIAIACTICLVLIGATYHATSQFSEIKHALDKLSGKIESMAGELANRINRLERDADDRRKDTWTRADQDLWCAKAEQRNAASGWRCPDAITMPFVAPSSQQRPAAPTAPAWRSQIR